jgi:hypothetical protein
MSCSLSSSFEGIALSPAFSLLDRRQLKCTHSQQKFDFREISLYHLEEIGTISMNHITPTTSHNCMMACMCMPHHIGEVGSD